MVLLGLGFTTRRLARRLLVRGVPVYGVSRNPTLANDLAALGLRFSDVPEDATIIHTVPPLPEPETAALRAVVTSLQPHRLIYISSTSVYGEWTVVDEHTAADASDAKGRARIAEETWVAAGEWQHLIVRPAAIYGPGRGVHTRIARGEPPRASGSGPVSRIHVDDLTAILDFAINSDITGPWPVADEYACPSDEINAWCARLVGKPLIDGAVTSSAGRTVDGQAIRAKLGIALAYPDYQSGILVSYAEELAGLHRQRARREITDLSSKTINGFHQA